MQPYAKQCPACKGSGKDSASITECSTCHGLRKVAPITKKQAKLFDVPRPFTSLKKYGFEPTKLFDAGSCLWCVVMPDEAFQMELFGGGGEA